jgi:hypothetical protein
MSTEIGGGAQIRQNHLIQVVAKASFMKEK